jgi:hypothetical protein
LLKEPVRHLLPITVVLLFWGFVSMAHGQTDPRVTGGLFGGRRPPDPNDADRTGQRLTLNVDLAAGAGETGGFGESGLIRSNQHQYGTSAAGAAELRHGWGTSRNRIDTAARGIMSFATAGVEQQLVASTETQAVIALGRRAGLRAGIAGAYEPTYLFNAFGAPPTAPGNGLLDVLPDTLITETFTTQRWLAASAFAGGHRNWTARQRGEVRYSTFRREPISGLGLISSSQTARVQHDWAPWERSSFQALYGFDQNRHLGTTLTRPIRSHRARLGMELQRRLGPGRMASLSISGGATLSRTQASEASQGVEFVTPSIAISSEVVPFTNWSFALSATRDVTVLEGLIPEPFETESASAIIEGRFGRRVELSVTGAFARGSRQLGTTGAFETTAGVSQIRFVVTRFCSMSATYSLYQHRTFDLDQISVAFPDQHRRSSLRVGVNLWLPLFGSFPN